MRKQKMKMVTHVISLWIFLILFVCSSNGRKITKDDIANYRQKVVAMFHHAYDGYIDHAYPYDELRPLTCDGHDTWGSFSLTLIDALDTLAVMGNFSEFRRVADIVIEKMNFDIDINASVFETNIRILGGLLSAHLLSKHAEMELEPGWPCTGPLLRLAEDVARRLLPAFDTPTGMPYGTINLRHGVPKGETTITCTAGIGTFIVEFGTLSRLIGDPVFEKVAMRALRSLWHYRSELGMVGNHIDVSTGKWTALDSGIGGGIDSYFEYLAKGAIMFDIPELLQMFHQYVAVVEKHSKRDDWYMWAHMQKGGITLPMFTSLDGYWPGIQSLLGDVDKAMKTMHNFHQVWRQFGFLPEYYNIPKTEAHTGREGYPLRPELIESAVYLYQATKDPFLLNIGIDAVESIEHAAKTDCGYATIKDVNTHQLDNRMESFFLAETTKYLYLLFDTENFIHNNGSRGTLIDTPNGKCVINAGGYFFNTEAHPIDMAAVYCCSSQKKEDDKVLQNMHDNLDLLSLFDITDSDDWVKGKKLKSNKEKKADKSLEKVQQSDLLKASLKDVSKDDLFAELKDKIIELKAALEDKIQKSNLSDTIKIENISQKIDSMFNITSGDKSEKTGTDKDQTLTGSVTTDDSVKRTTNAKDSSIGSTHSAHNSLETEQETNSTPEPERENQHVDDIQKTEQANKAADNIKTESDNENISGENSESANIASKENVDKDAIVTTQTEPNFQTVYIHQKNFMHPKTDQLNKATSKKDSRQDVSNIERVFNLLLGYPEAKSIPVNNSPNIYHLYRSLQYYPTTYTSKPELMSCKALPFHMRFSVNGEFFEDYD